MIDRVCVYILTAMLLARVIFDIVFWVKRTYDEKKCEKQVYENEIRNLKDRLNMLEEYITKNETE